MTAHLQCFYGETSTAAERCQDLLDLLATEVEFLATAMIVIREDGDDRFVPVAVWPRGDTAAIRLADCAERALRERRGIELLHPEHKGVNGKSVTQLAVPVETERDIVGVIAAGTPTNSHAQRQQLRRQLYWASAWVANIGLSSKTSVVQTRLGDIERMAHMLLSTQNANNLAEASHKLAAALVDEFGLYRCCVGIATQRRVSLYASASSPIESPRPTDEAGYQAAMKEAFEQDIDILYPTYPESDVQATFPAKTEAHRALLASAPNRLIQTLLLPVNGRAVGVVVLEYPVDPAPTAAHLARAVSVVRLLAPVIAEKCEQTRWLTGRLPRKIQASYRKLVSPYHASWKLYAATALFALLLLALAKGPFRVSAKTIIEGEVQRALVAPYDGYIRTSPVRAGDTVAAGQILATLDDRDIRLDKVRWENEAEQAQRKYQDALAKHDRAAAAISAAQLQEARAELELANEKLGRAVIRAPFDGVIVTGDLTQLRGSAVEQGKVLYEVTPLDVYRVVLKVDERDISFLRVGQQGVLALSGLAGRPFPFSVNRITPVANSEEGVTYYRAEAKLSEVHPGLRPGMQGVGKILIGPAKYAWIWTRPLTDWIRLSVWSWRP